MRYTDLTGHEFGLLKVIRRCGTSKDNRALWECKCRCGNTIIVDTHSLTTGNTKSCGCQKYGGRLTHGEAKNGQTRLYRIWSGMKNRCKNKSHIGYYIYGGKGITVCDDWLDFEMFRKWAVSNGYDNDLTIDRIDSNEGYYPKNCRWTSYKTQSNNTSRNHYLSINGKTMTISQWSEESGIPDSTIEARINRLGWTPQEAVSIPVRGAYHVK